MSLDLDLMEDGESVFTVNLTYNYSRMWAKALGAESREFDPPRSFFADLKPENPVRMVEIEGMTGAESEAVLWPAIEAMEADMAGFRELNPPNGWGDADLLLGHLRRCVVAAAAHPEAVWEAWR